MQSSIVELVTYHDLTFWEGRKKTREIQKEAGVKRPRDERLDQNLEYGAPSEGN